MGIVGEGRQRQRAVSLFSTHLSHGERVECLQVDNQMNSFRELVAFSTTKPNWDDVTQTSRTLPDNGMVLLFHMVKTCLTVDRLHIFSMVSRELNLR